MRAHVSLARRAPVPMLPAAHCWPIAYAMLGTQDPTAARELLALPANTKIYEEVVFALAVPSTATHLWAVQQTLPALAILDLQEQTVSHAQYANDTLLKAALETPLVQHAPTILLHQLAVLLALCVQQDSTRVTGAVWGAQAVLHTRPLHQEVLILEIVSVLRRLRERLKR